ncbi:hypothetical protein LCGC14_0603260 [marine sediment metagenome]|uniref:Uncharacterized protein n=1 Tax=marine sediment metagenome TaxID=412755 RepID=A0A0F9TW36_9ZZZZ
MVETKIGKCGCKIFHVSRFEGLYCFEYCCNCCPDKYNSPCQNEKKEGTLFENLVKYDNTQKEFDDEFDLNLNVEMKRVQDLEEYDPQTQNIIINFLFFFRG